MEMFKKFRNKVLLLNMTITSAVLLSAFSVIYFITYSNISSEIQSKLDQTPGLQSVIQDGEEGAASGEINRPGVVMTVANDSSSDGYLMFSIIVDAQGKILEKASGINLEPEFYEQAAKIAWDNPDNKADVTLRDKQWRYAVTPIIGVQIGTDGEINNYTTDKKFSVVFLDVTAYNKTLFDLLTTLLLVGSVTLGVIFLVSLYFANRTIKPLADAWQKQKQFVADASHELKTPLSIINANYDALLANQEETIQSQIKWLDYMRIGTDRMAKLINDLLTLARFDDTKPAMQTISFNLSNTVEAVLSSMEAAIIEKGIELSVSIGPNITVKSDPEGLKQVVAILLDNAIKYTDKNGQIEVVLARSNHQAVFSIKNSGTGIPEQELPKIFDRFYRADQSRTHENGSYGLGLSIAKAVMDRLGGEIQVQSVAGEYTTFTFRLKLQ
jgi:two-component system sensor histidine kinase CiaH